MLRHPELGALQLVRVRDDAADEALARAWDVGEPRGDHATGARLGGPEPPPARAGKREHELLDAPFVAGEEPPLEALRERRLERIGALLRPGLDEEIDVDLEVMRADRRLDAVTVPAGLLERPGDRGLADAEQAQPTPP